MAVIENYLTNGKYDPFKSECRQAELVRTRVKPSKAQVRADFKAGLIGHVGLFDQSFGKIKANLNNTVRKVDAQIETLQEITTQDVYHQEKSRWNSGTRVK